MTCIEQEPSSMDHIRRTDMFPRKDLVREDDNLRVPFPLLTGEDAEFLGRTTDGIIVLSNYRLLIRYKETFINVPLGIIENVEMRDIFYLIAYCKDATVVRCAFSTNDVCQEWFKRLSSKIEPQYNLVDVFAFRFHAWCSVQSPGSSESSGSSEECQQLCPQGPSSVYSFTSEVERMGFDIKSGSAWRYTEINKAFSLCSSYPAEHIVPWDITDEMLKKVAGFRTIGRFPSVVWRNCRNGAVLARCSQPEMGFFGWRNTDDENLVCAIPRACVKNPGRGRDEKSRARRSLSKEDGSGSDISSKDSSTIDDEDDEPRKMLIIDCRSYSAAFANRAKGGGVECPEYYSNCEIQFMSLANIHAIRKSFLALRTLCSNVVDQASWLSGLEGTKWLQNIAGLLKVASLVATVNEKEGRPVLIHCSDGWDRTPQIISLAELMLDPYYRTVRGFQVLVEREWLQFGHKFADRCGNGTRTDDGNERCPVFLQWLDCVYQLTVQFPCQFEFNEAFLVKLVQHTYSCLFGTFLCNTLKERVAMSLDKETASIWSLLSLPKFFNYLYEPAKEHEVLYGASQVQSLRLWSSVYLSNNSSFAGPEDTSTQAIVAQDSSETSNLQKTRSCENLIMTDMNTSLSRRKSDPNITMEHCEQQAQKLLKDAIGGDTSCSSDSTSTKSSDNERSLSDNGDSTLHRLDSPGSSSGSFPGTPDTPSTRESSIEVDQDEGEAVVDNGQNGMNNGNNGHVSLGAETDTASDNNSDKCDNGDSEQLKENGHQSEVDTMHNQNMENGGVGHIKFTSSGNGSSTTDKDDSTIENGDSRMGNGHNEDCTRNGDTDSPNSTEENVDYSLLEEKTASLSAYEAKSSLEMNGLTNGHSKPNGDIHNGDEHILQNNGSPVTNGHSDANGRVHSPDSAHDSSENSIETISEGEECDSTTLNGANSEHNGEHKETATKHKTNNVRISNSFNNGDCRDIDNRVISMKLRQRAINSDKYARSLESSTDTVTEDVHNADSSHTLTPSGSEHSSNRVASLLSLCDKVTTRTLNAIDNTISISTSTSDLTDSRVLDKNLANGLLLGEASLLNVTGAESSSLQTSLKLRCFLSQTSLIKGRNGSCRGAHEDSSTGTSQHPASMSPRSHSSTCPPTPGTSDARSLESTVPRCGLSRHLDEDGLTRFSDPVQRQIVTIQGRYEAEISRLKEQVDTLQSMLAQHASACNGDICNLEFKRGQESPGSCDLSSIKSNYSNAASDASWDQMDDPEVNIARWVPDHTVTHCAGCEAQFTLLNRRHHCRNCGKIFCHTCSQETVPLPHQMIDKDQRVCQLCYTKITQQLAHSIIVMDTCLSDASAMAAAASN